MSSIDDLSLCIARLERLYESIADNGHVKMELNYVIAKLQDYKTEEKFPRTVQAINFWVQMVCLSIIMAGYVSSMRQATQRDTFSRSCGYAWKALKTIKNAVTTKTPWDKELFEIYDD